MTHFLTMVDFMIPILVVIMEFFSTKVLFGTCQFLRNQFLENGGLQTCQFLVQFLKTRFTVSTKPKSWLIQVMSIFFPKQRMGINK
jgi:hypothetical protein